jgi:hypothetical protein
MGWDGFTLLTPGLLADLGVEAWPNHLVASSVVALSCWRWGVIGRRRMGGGGGGGGGEKQAQRVARGPEREWLWVGPINPAPSKCHI